MALSSLPPEVGLCVSSTGVVAYGICAKREIPPGAWIGPYEGKFVKPKELSSVADTTYMWEIYNDDKLAGFIDGSDETVSSWMRYIRCARHKQEQNLFAFQYLGKVYYRSFKPILPDQELLVWYDEKYPQYFGIPTATFDLATVIKSGASAHPDELVVVSPRENTDQQLQIKNQSSFFPSPPPSPLSLSTSPSRLSHRLMDVEHPSPRGTNDNNIRTVAPDAERVGLTLDTSIKADDCQSYMTSLNRHESAPAGLWTCVQCDSRFPQKNMLQTHQCIHTPKKPYRCGRCSESFSNPTQLNTHAVSHENSKPFKCGFCSRSFSGTTTLNNHIRKHTGEAFSYRVRRTR